MAEGENLPVLSRRHPRAWKPQWQEAQRWQKELATAPKLCPLPGPGCSVAAVHGESPTGGRGGAELHGLAGGDLSKVSPSHKIIQGASLSAPADDGSSGCGSCVYYSAARFDAYHPEG